MFGLHDDSEFHGQFLELSLVFLVMIKTTEGEELLQEKQTSTHCLPLSFLHEK